MDSDRYHDLLGADADPDRQRLIAHLDAGYRTAEYGVIPLPPSLARPPAAQAPMPHPPTSYLTLLAGAGPAMEPVRRRGIRLWPILVFAAVLALVSGATLATVATGTITDLGKPTNTLSTSAYFPLSGFHRVPVSLHQGRKPELLFLGAAGTYDLISIERWPLVKALDQFGKLTGALAVDRQCVTEKGGPTSGRPDCDDPTFDLSHAHYSSPYLAFVSKDLIHDVGAKSVLYQRMNATEKKIFTRYARTKTIPECARLDAKGNPIVNASHQLETYPCKDLVDYVNATIQNGQSESSTNAGRTLPLITIGGYLQTSSQTMKTGDFAQSIALTPPPNTSIINYGYDQPYTFAQIQTFLQQQHEPGTGSHLIEDVNGEANIITALICHADGSKPKSVCGRPAIRKILKHVK